MPKTVYQRKKCPLEIFVGGRHDTNSDAKKSTLDFVTKMYFNEGRQKRGKVRFLMGEMFDLGIAPLRFPHSSFKA